MSSYKYETFATNLYDNFSDNSLVKNWENYEELGKIRRIGENKKKRKN